MSRELSIRSRLLLAFGVLLLLGAVQAGVVAWASREAGRAVTTLTDVLSVKKRFVAEAREANGESARLTIQFLLLMDFPMAADYRQQLDKAREQASATAAALAAALQGDEHQEQLRAVQATRGELARLQDKVLDMVKAGKGEEAVGLWARDSGTLLGKARAALDSALVTIEGSYQETVLQIKRRMQLMVWVIGGAFAVSCVLTMLLAWAITRSITRPLAQALAATEAVARGELGRTMAVQGRDELSRLQRSLAHATTHLRETMQRIHQASATVRAASGEIAAGSHDLSGRAEQQASSLEQTAASVQQLNVTVRNNAQTAAEASRLAASASQAARSGGQAMAEVVSRMAGIRQSSSRIAEIISVIDGIAFQTNILALNAAVESARAGEQGRGFAVVAGEVRSLAQRAAQAAREIKALISDSVEQVGAGSEMVGRAGTSISELVAQVQRVSGLIDEISTASGEQQLGIGQINQAVEQLDHMTQQTAAMVERSANTSQALRGQADELTQAVQTFRLEPVL